MGRLILRRPVQAVRGVNSARLQNAVPEAELREVGRVPIASVPEFCLFGTGACFNSGTGCLDAMARMYLPS